MPSYNQIKLQKVLPRYDATHLMIQSERYHFDMKWWREVVKKHLDENICLKILLEQPFSSANFLFLIEQQPHFLILIQIGQHSSIQNCTKFVGFVESSGQNSL